MSRPKKYIEIVFIILLALLSCYSIYEHFNEGSVLSIHNYLGFVFLVVFILLKFVWPEREFYGVFILLILSTFNLVNFSVFVGTLNNFPFNVIFFITLLVYSIANMDMVIQIIKRVFKGSEIELEENKTKTISFYYDKFRDCDQEEFRGLLSDLKNYPDEAKIALTRIKKERNII